MNKHTDLLGNTLLIAIGKFLSQLISLFLLPIYTLYLSPSDYGYVDLILTYITLLVPALTMQMEMAAFRFLIDARGDEEQKTRVISNVFQIVISAAGLIVILSVAFAQVINVRYATLIIINSLVTIFANIFLQFARGLGKNKHYATASIVTGVSTLIGTALFVMRTHCGARGVLVAMILSNAACLMYLFWVLKLHNYIDLQQGSREIKKQLFRYSLPLVPNGLSWWVISVSDRTIVTIALGLSANGIYAVSAKYTMIYASIFSVFSMALTESASLHINDKDSSKFLSQTNNASLKIFGSIGLGLIAICPFMFKWFIGARFQQASNYVPILIVAAFFSTVVGVYSAIYIANKMTKQVASSSIFAALINVSLTICFVKSLGIYAAALATAVAYLVMAVYRHIDLKKIVHIKYEKWLLYKIGAAYTTVIGLFYARNMVADICNLTIVAITILVLNKSILTYIKNIILSTKLLSSRL